MMKRTYKETAVSAGGNNFNPIILDKSNLGFSPADTLCSIQVATVGLDSGTYSVKFLPVDGLGYVDFETAVPETSAAIMHIGFLVDAVKIEFANCGNNAAPRSVITFISRSF